MSFKHLAGWRLAGLGLVAAFSLLGSGCTDALKGDDDKDTQYVERPVDQIYNDAWKQINNGEWVKAAKQFDEVERQHPYSVWARRAMLMSAYCYYEGNFLSRRDLHRRQLHPASSRQPRSLLCLLSEGDVAL